MTRKSLLAIAAIASFGALALASTDASARGFGGGGFRGGGMHAGGMHVGGGVRSVGFRGGHSFRRIVHVRPHWHHWHHRWHFGWRRPYWVTPVIGAGVATYPVAAPTYNRCTCLTKEYTPEGAVVFKDLCTQESAMNPPELPAAVQQGNLQPPLPQPQVR